MTIRENYMHAMKNTIEYRRYRKIMYRMGLIADTKRKSVFAVFYMPKEYRNLEVFLKTRVVSSSCVKNVIFMFFYQDL